MINYAQAIRMLTDHGYILFWRHEKHNDGFDIILSQKGLKDWVINIVKERNENHYYNQDENVEDLIKNQDLYGLFNLLCWHDKCEYECISIEIINRYL